MGKVEFALTTLNLDPNTANLLGPVFPLLGFNVREEGDRKDVVTELVARIIERFTSLVSPLVLMIDDAHWMDSLSYKVPTSSLFPLPPLGSKLLSVSSSSLG